MRIFSTYNKIKIFIKINKIRLLEFVRFDSKIASAVLFTVYLLKYNIVKFLSGKYKALIIASDIYRHINFPFAKNYSTKLLKQYIKKDGINKVGVEIFNIVSEDIDQELLVKLQNSIKDNDNIHPFDKRLLILSPPLDDQKGVIIVKFSDYFKYVRKVFDTKKLSQHYVLIAEPSSIGLFDLDLLCLINENMTVIVETQEPVDQKFIECLNVNFSTTDIGANCWVDNRVFFPIKNLNKKFDLIMVSIFSDVKRHYHLFESLKKCQDKLKVALVGVPWPKSMEELANEARYYGVQDQITFFEGVSQKKINMLLNESKCFLLLSKKEGSNKAGIEALFSNIPAYYIKGYNYGHQYSFINSKTGGFIEINKLAQFLDNLDALIDNTIFSPYEWVLHNQNPVTSTDTIIKSLKKIETIRSIKINKELLIKINNPDLDYFDDNDWVEMKPYYRRLKNYFIE